MRKFLISIAILLVIIGLGIGVVQGQDNLAPRAFADQYMAELPFISNGPTGFVTGVNISSLSAESSIVYIHYRIDRGWDYTPQRNYLMEPFSTIRLYTPNQISGSNFLGSMTVRADGPFVVTVNATGISGVLSYSFVAQAPLQ